MSGSVGWAHIVLDVQRRAVGLGTPTEPVELAAGLLAHPGVLAVVVGLPLGLDLLG
ncbi:MAG: hypothetical protein ACRCTR_07090 [Actinomycetota bacterium]